MCRFIIVVFVLVACQLNANSQAWSVAVPSRAVYSICSDPQQPQVIYAGNVARTILKSTDGGVVWEERAIGTQGGSSTIDLVAVHPTKSNIVFAAGQGMSGLARSTDGGATWTTVLDTPDGFRFELGGSGSLAFDWSHPDTVYALRFAYGEVYRSVNGGGTWSKLSTLPDIESSDNMRAISVCPDSANVLIVSGRRAHIYRSTDYGATWKISQTLTAYRDTDVANFAWSPSVPGTVYATTQMSLFYNVSNAGLYKSIDYGVSWNRIALTDTALYAIMITPTKNGDELLLGGCQFYYPADNGTIRGDSMVFRSAGIDTAYAQVSDVPWTENETGVVGYNVYGFARTLRDGYPIVLMASDGGVFSSSNITSVHEESTGKQTVYLRIDNSGFEVPNTMQGACRYAISNMCGMVLTTGTAIPGSIQQVESTWSGLLFITVTDGHVVAHGMMVR